MPGWYGANYGAKMVILAVSVSFTLSKGGVVRKTVEL